jgi:hypothetical protein
MSEALVTRSAGSFLERLKEIDMFFDGSAPVHQTMRRLTERLQQAGIPYAVMGGMAVNAHGARRTTQDLDVLLTAEGLQQFRQRFVGSAYDQGPKRSRHFIDRDNGVGIDVLVTGHYPGRGGPGPFAFPDPTEASEEINQVRVVTLPQLVQLKLAARRYYDFGDVVFLIRVHDLDESFADKLHPSVRQDYIECLEEKRREDEYKAREEIG